MLRLCTATQEEKKKGRQLGFKLVLDGFKLFYNSLSFIVLGLLAEKSRTLVGIFCDVCEILQLWGQESLEPAFEKSQISKSCPKERAFDLSGVSRKRKMRKKSSFDSKFDTIRTSIESSSNLTYSKRFD